MWVVVWGGEVFEVLLACLWLLAGCLGKKETVESFGPGHSWKGRLNNLWLNQNAEGHREEDMLPGH